MFVKLMNQILLKSGIITTKTLIHTTIIPVVLYVSIKSMVIHHGVHGMLCLQTSKVSVETIITGLNDIYFQYYHNTEAVRNTHGLASNILRGVCQVTADETNTEHLKILVSYIKDEYSRTVAGFYQFLNDRIPGGASKVYPAYEQALHEARNLRGPASFLRTNALHFTIHYPTNIHQIFLSAHEQLTLIHNTKTLAATLEIITPFPEVPHFRNHILTEETVLRTESTLYHTLTSTEIKVHPIVLAGILYTISLYIL
jgi:hypothetical protein